MCVCLWSVCVCICGQCVCVFVVGVCVFVVGVCVCFWLCLLVVSNASMVDLLLYVITVGKIEIWNQWFDVQFCVAIMRDIVIMRKC